jgi:predicted lipoprotein with Yx(FWY)xxD motif
LPKPAIPNPRPIPIRLVPVALALLALLAAAGASAIAPSKRVVKEADNPTLGKTILTNNRGHTLYSLSAETKGRFICVGGCLASWKPLLVPKAVKPTGPVKLRTRVRPDGRTQVTYKGLPLYTFNGDVKPGNVEGEGIKDVGTWHAAAAPPQPSAGQPAPEPSPPPPPYPNPYGY